MYALRNKLLGLLLTTLIQAVISHFNILDKVAWKASNALVQGQTVVFRLVYKFDPARGSIVPAHNLLAGRLRSNQKSFYSYQTSFAYILK